MIRTIIFIVSINFLFINCVSNKTKDEKRIIYYKSSIDEPLKKKKYQMTIPKGFSVENEDFNNEYNQVKYVYKNNMIIYITDNYIGGSGLNGDNKLDAGIDIIYRKSFNDSVYMHGQQKDNRYWKENILEDIVVGYLNVHTEYKEEFDKALESLIEK